MRVKDLSRGIVEERVSVRVHHGFRVIGLNHSNGHPLLNTVILFIELGESVLFRVNHKVMLNLIPTIIFLLLSRPHHVCDIGLHFWFILEVPEQTRVVRAKDPGLSSDRVCLFRFHGLKVDNQASLYSASDIKSLFAFVSTLTKIKQAKAYCHRFLDKCIPLAVAALVFCDPILNALSDLHPGPTFRCITIILTGR